MENLLQVWEEVREVRHTIRTAEPASGEGWATGASLVSVRMSLLARPQASHSRSATCGQQAAAASAAAAAAVPAAAATAAVPTTVSAATVAHTGAI